MISLLDGPVYMIRRKDNHIFFFYRWLEAFDLDVALWTPNLAKAREFYTEQSVEEFFSDHLRNRPCEIVRVRIHPCS